MPASIISAPTGGSPNVIGNNIATVAIVPMPGSTPTSVPTRAPIRQSSRLVGDTATPKPRARFEKISITPSPQNAWEKLKRQPKRIGEQQAATDRQAYPDDDRLGPFRFRRTHCGDDETQH